MKLKKILVAAMFALFISISSISTRVYAADAMVVFGSDAYEADSGEEFPVGVYIDGDTPIGYYRVKISYDTNYIEYLGGATSGGDGEIVFEGGSDLERVSTMLQFRALSGGNTELSITEAEIRESDNNGESFNVTERAIVPIALRGEVITTSSEAVSEADSTTATAVTSETVTDDKQENETSVESNESVTDDNGKFIPLFIILALAGVLAAITAFLVVRKTKRKKAYRSKITGSETMTKGNNVENTLEKSIDMISDDSDEIPEVFISHPIMADVPHIITSKAQRDESNFIELDSVSKGQPVIQVKNVSMTFKVSGSDSSGFKDYMIQKAQGKLKRRELKALDNISFDVYKGEIVGIVGTNGSGKSTLLKIVSGALLPTSGQVIADYDKIQLLSLGTGFDTELSARENVYLNGAIIGYTKEFIDAHYDEIVEFAELQGFMEEKVKNFSSGMVSRLGFSIATVAGAAEILILDEVLSVGDQFFRKKSLERVQQMIHGGSTVLIVSHNLATIKTHCTKAIWIEKGKLRMIGEPKKVCEAYSNQKTEVKLNKDGVWACFKGGVVQRDFSGIEINDEGIHVIFKNGIQDKSVNMSIKIDNDLLYFEKGVANKSYTGIAKTSENEIVLFKEGTFQSDFTGSKKASDNRYMYFKKGRFDNGFNGSVDGRKFTKGVSEATLSDK